MNEPLSGSGPIPATKGKRFGSAAIDLLLIPIVLGFVIGLALISLPEGPRSLILILVNIGWFLFRDLVYSPGRAFTGLKLVSLDSEKVSLVQALVRNILLIVPFVLIVGYIVEIISIYMKGDRVADAWAKTRVVAA